jgi:hypothetical protein
LSKLPTPEKLGGTAAQRYSKLEQPRSGFLDRGRECAALTVPAILPPAGFSETSKLPTPYQSLGARGVRTLASKLLLSLFPGSVPFFNWRVDDQVLQTLGEKRGEIEKALSARERAVATELDTSVFRPAAFVALQHLIVTGNACIEIPPEQPDRARVYRLDQYVTRRSPNGRLLEFVIKESTDFNALDLEDQVALGAKANEANSNGQVLDEMPLDLYTHGFWDRKTRKWWIYQEIMGTRLENTVGSYKDGELPFLFLRFSTQPGESYGRSYVEELLGDLDSLEALSETLVESSGASARVIFVVRPGGVTNLQVVAEAKNGDVIAGDPEDVGVIQVQKQADLQVAKAQAEEIASRLSYAFLLHSSVQRAGERVTAEEIRFMASELDDGLGGAYTLLAADFQLPAVRLFERRMEKRLKAPPIDTKLVTPVIVAGLEAIGRGHSQNNLRAFMGEIVQALTPEIAIRYLKPAEFISRAAAAYSIDTEGLIPTPEEIAQAEAAAQAQAMMQHLGPNAINQAGGAIQKAMEGQGSVPSVG